MRKIEQEMVKAVKERRNWKSGDTEVKIINAGGHEKVRVTLHDNTIAEFYSDGVGFVHNSNWQTWPTRTTASRLRALGFAYNKKEESWN